MNPAAPPLPRWAALLLRILLYLAVGMVTWIFTADLLYYITGRVMASVLSTLLAAIIANLIVLRTTENLYLRDVGLYWNAAARRNLLLGVGAGAIAALLVVAPFLLAGAATLTPDVQAPFTVPGFLFVTLSLMIGVAGEELLFRGYAFQSLTNQAGAIASVGLISALFGWGHLNNPHASWLGALNTALWGVMLGAAVLRTRDLWLAIGLHFGWNFVLPLFGVPLSGLTIKLSGWMVQWRIGPLWSGGEYGPEAGLPTLLVLPLLGWFLWKAPLQPERNPVLLGTSVEE